MCVDSHTFISLLPHLLQSCFFFNFQLDFVYTIMLCSDAQLCPTLCSPLDCKVAHWASLSVEFSRPRILEWLPFPPPGDLPDPEIEPKPLTFPTLAGRFFTSITWEAQVFYRYLFVKSIFIFSFPVVTALRSVSYLTCDNKNTRKS